MANRKRPCEFCECEIIESQAGNNGFQLSFESYPDNGCICVVGFAFDETGETQELMYEIEMNYCPKCGRKLDL